MLIVVPIACIIALSWGVFSLRLARRDDLSILRRWIPTLIVLSWIMLGLGLFIFNAASIAQYRGMLIVTAAMVALLTAAFIMLIQRRLLQSTVGAVVWLVAGGILICWSTLHLFVLGAVIA